MRQKYWHSGYHCVRYICDRCKCDIGNAKENTKKDHEISEQYEGMNTGQHECKSCRKKREHAYDAYVTNPSR